MKTILTLLLLLSSCVAWGQESPDSTVNPFKIWSGHTPDDDAIIHYPHNPVAVVHECRVMDSVVILWDQYCEALTALSTPHLTLEYDGRPGSEKMKEYEDKQAAVAKSKYALDHFIEFLRRRK